MDDEELTRMTLSDPPVSRTPSISLLVLQARDLQFKQNQV